METIEQRLDNWLNKYVDTKNVFRKLLEANKQLISEDSTVTITFTKKEIYTLIEEKACELHSIKESIIDCSNNFIQERKKK